MKSITKHTTISLGLAISLLIGAIWVGRIDARVAEVERQESLLWKKSSKIEKIGLGQAEIKGELKAIKSLLENR